MSYPPPRPELVAFARWLRAQLRARRISGNALALKLGISKGGVSEYTRALRRPRLETLRLIARELDTPLDDLERMLPADAADAALDAAGPPATAPASGMVAPAITATVAFRSPRTAAFLFGMVGALDSDGVELTAEEEASIQEFLQRIADRHRARRGTDAAEGGARGPVGPE